MGMFRGKFSVRGQNMQYSIKIPITFHLKSVMNPHDYDVTTTNTPHVTREEPIITALKAIQYVM